MKLAAEFKPEYLTAVIDTREQTPFDLLPLLSIGGTLAAGDYSVLGLEHSIAIERKSLPDLVSCFGGERERFERELHRMLAYPTRAVIVEAAWSDLEAGEWRSQITPKVAVASVVGWIAQGIPFVFPGSRMQAEAVCRQMLFIAARRHWRIARALAAGIIEAEAAA